MDDDIEIEEHDILDHPLVKAVFPDLSKIKLQVHSEAYDSSLLQNEESNLFEEIPNGIEDKSAENVYRGNGEEFENSEQNHLQEEYLDKEPDNAGQVDFLQAEGNIDNSYKTLPDDINRTSNRQVNIVHEISDDEAIAEVTEENDINLANETQTSTNGNCVEISDDEEENISINGPNSTATDIDEVITVREIAKDDEHKNGNNHSVDNDNSDIENIGDVNEVCMIDNQSVATEVTNDEKEENWDAKVDQSDELIGDLLEENQNSTLESVQKSDRSSFNDEDVNEANQKVSDEYITGDLLDEDENRHNVVDNQNEVDEMDTEMSVETYIGAPIKQEIEDVPIKEENIDDFSEEYNFDESASRTGRNTNISPTFTETFDYIPNKIILGSKPSPTISPTVRPHNNYSLLMVCLEDWGKFLNQSPCYCHKCKILFTTPNSLDCHNMSDHSLLAPLTNRAVKSTAKSYNHNIAKKSTSYTDLDKSTHCNHCDKNFKDNIALIKHLYELLPQKYNCNVCNKTFNSQIDLANHSAVHVNPEPRKILKAKRKLDNPMLRSLLTQKPKIPIKAKNIPPNVIKVPVNINTEPVDDPGFKFKCMVCSDILSNYGLARRHRENHPEKKNQMIFKKIITISKLKRTKDKIVFEDEKPIKKHKLTKDPSKCDDDSKSVEIVPKSALFQCPKCRLHFTSTIAGLAHMVRTNCDLKSKCPIWTCPTCKKKMRRKDTEIHKRQHQMSTKLKIYKVTRNMHERTLCKCLKCNVHFDYILLKMHLKNCGKIPTAKCQKCNILLMKNKLLGHMTKHDVLKLKRKDFIFVEYMLANDKSKKINQLNTTGKKAVPTSSYFDITKPLTVKTKPGMELTQKFLNLDRSEKTRTKKFRLYFCDHCKICLTVIRKTESHLAKTCAVYTKQSFACNLCGLFLPWNTKETHARLHQQKNFSINDVQFVDLVTKKPIALPMIKYTSCQTCKIHFLTKGDRRKHICGEDYENCEYCGDMFEVSTLKLHREFHRARTLIIKSKTEKSKTETSVIPELMMRYESLNPTWNILFICSNCDLVTDLYNKAVEHSQDHLKKNYKQPKSITCYICNLLFDETCWAKHKELHTQMPIKRKVFNILTYTPENLLEESWFQMFESVPEQEIRQIIDQSVYGGERSLKMKLMKSGLPEFTLYCCSNCQVCYDTNSQTAHINVKCKGSKYRCSECEIAFENESTLSMHKLLHEKRIKKEEFRIIHFIKTTQDFVKTSSTKNLTVSSKMQEDRLSLSPTNVSQKVDPKALAVLMEVRERRARNVEIDYDAPLELKPRAKFSLYRCIKCSACILMKIYRNVHKCAPAHELHFCKICKQNINARRKGNHKVTHDLNPNFRPKNTNIFEFDSKDIIYTKKIYKKSDINERTKKNNKIIRVISSKAKSINGNKKVIATSSKPSKVKRVNSVECFENLVKTVTRDYKTEESKSGLNSAHESYIDQGHRRSFKIYKCKCGLHYTSIKTIDKHMETCDSGVEISTDNCSKCGLLFPTDILVSHLCKHHSVAINPDITIEEVKNNKNNSSETRANTGANKKKTAKETNNTEEIKDKNKSDYIKIYKCGECQVYYLNASTCYKHAYKNHVKLNSRKFIVCDLCGLAFTLATLQVHIKRHHETELDLDKVLVEEYHPSTGKEALKIDVYFASERVQNVQDSSSNLSS